MDMPCVRPSVGVLLWAAICFMIHHSVTGIVILLPQQNFLVPFDSGDIITYECEVDSIYAVVWGLVNFNAQFQPLDPPGTPRLNTSYLEGSITIEDGETNNRNILNRSRLYFSVSHYNVSEYGSELIIGCFPYTTFNRVFPRHSINVYGPLEDPSSLQFSAFSETHLKLSWSGPQVPPGVQIINFVQVTNLSSGIVEVFNTSENSITFNEVGVCSEFNLTVLSFNEEVGESGMAFTLQNIPISPDVSPITESLATIVALDNDLPSITIVFRPANVCSNTFPVENYNVMFENATMTVPPVTNCGDDDRICVSINDTIIPGLSVDQALPYSIASCSNVTCRTTETFMAYTTSIQRPTIYFTRDSTNVLAVCDFSSGSNASGCAFTFTATSGEVGVETYNLTQDSKQLNTSLCEGSQVCVCITTERFITSYSSVEAYALEEDGVTRSSISIPSTKMDVSENSSSIAVCNPSPTNLEPGENDSHKLAVVGGVLGGVIFIIIVIVVILVIGCIVVKRRGMRKQRNHTAQGDGDKRMRLDEYQPLKLKVQILPEAQEDFKIPKTAKAVYIPLSTRIEDGNDCIACKAQHFQNWTFEESM